MINAIYVKNGESSTETHIDKIPQILEQAPRLIWVDICVENNEMSLEEIALLTESFKIHELSIEDCLFPQYHPKIEEFENYVFAAVHGLKPNVKDLSDFDNSIYELDMLIGKGFVVTVHAGELLVIESLLEKAKLKPQIELRSLENLLYNIFQKVVSSYEFTIEKIGDKIDDIEDRILQDPSNEMMSEVFSIKKSLLNLRKVTEPQKNIYTYFTRETTMFVSRKSTAYFRDIFDQFESINQSIASYNQLISSVLEIYMSSATHKLNKVIKFLTVIATIFLPGVLIASYYGMNVAFPEHRIFGTDYVWYFAMTFMVGSTLGIFWYMKKKKWL